jgi:hypothetical protein
MSATMNEKHLCATDNNLLKRKMVDEASISGDCSLLLPFPVKGFENASELGPSDKWNALQSSVKTFGGCVDVYCMEKEGGKKRLVSQAFVPHMEARSPILASMAEQEGDDKNYRTVIIRGADKSAVSTLLCFIARGTPFQGLAFDAGEVLILAHRYDVAGVSDWIAEHCITDETLCAAADLAHRKDLLPEDFRKDLMWGCSAHIRHGDNGGLDLLKFLSDPENEECLRGVSAEAAAFIQGELLLDESRCGITKDVSGEVFKFMCRWGQVNNRGRNQIPFTMSVFMDLHEHDFRAMDRGLFADGIDVAVYDTANQSAGRIIIKDLDPFGPVEELAFKIYKHTEGTTAFFKEEWYRTMYYCGKEMELGKPLIHYGIWCTNLDLPVTLGTYSA